MKMKERQICPQECPSLMRAVSIAALLVLAAAYATAAPIVVDPNAVPCITPSLHFTTIQAAVNAAPSGATIHVCPANYGEQVMISQALTLKGVSSGNVDNPVITSPPGGVASNATSAGGNAVGAEVFVSGTGPVNISDIAVDGSGNGLFGCSVVLMGIYYQSASGTVSHVSVRNQISGCGYPIVVENTSSANQAVAVRESSIHDFDAAGIVACSGAAGCFFGPGSGTPPTITLTSNSIAGSNSAFGPSNLVGIYLNGAGGSVSANLLSGFGDAIILQPTTTASITGNTIEASQYGVAVNSSAGVSVTSNRLFRNGTGVVVIASNSTVQNNLITDSGGLPTSVGVELGCSGTNNNVTSNTINDVGTGTNNVPGGNTTTPNNYFNVPMTKTTC